MKTKHYLCIHGHFYQPPRENPWLEAIDYQETASPFHDWNERIDFQCYRPNGRARILDNEGRVVRLTNNYGRISYNFGPTVLSWLEAHDPGAYRAVLDGDRRSAERYGGHGSAIAQAYNHVILPLANRRDKETEIKWGLRDFERRFGRAAEAMWLPETAVDLETLEILADHGMKFVILAPRQARAVRAIGHEHWHTVHDGRVDSRQPYRIGLPGGKSIAAFFYDGHISQAVAFEGLLYNGETFAHRLTGDFDDRARAQLLHIATDGESYGHHHRNGDMALAYALDYITKKDGVTLTNYGQYLELFPPDQEAQIHENSSWSCVHGVERWRADCGCNSGMRHDWRQAWRAPLRDGIDRMRDALTGPYEALMARHTDDPWGARNGYIDVILDRSDESRRAFFRQWLREEPGPEAEVQILKALELQRNLLLAYTSCAWFFDEISGTEAVQNLQYAARVIELARDVFDVDLEDDFLATMATAPSNIPEFGDGAYVYSHFALPAKVDFLKVAAHLAAMTLFAERARDGTLYCFDYHWHHFERLHSGKAQMICAHVRLTSRITTESQDIEFAIIHLGDHNINVGALPYSGDASYRAMAREFMEVFGHGDIAKSLRLLDKYFGSSLISLNELFRDQRRAIVDTVMRQTLEDVEDQFGNIYQQHHPVMRYLSDINVALPPVFSHIARFVQGSRIEGELDDPDMSVEKIQRYLLEAKRWGIDLDAERISRHYLAALRRIFTDIRAGALCSEHLRQFSDLLDLRLLFPFEVDLDEVQSDFAAWVFSQPPCPADAPADCPLLLGNVARQLKIRLPESAAP